MLCASNAVNYTDRNDSMNSTILVYQYTATDYKQTNKQSNRLSQSECHEKRTHTVSAHTVNPRIEVPGFYQYNLP